MHGAFGRSRIAARALQPCSGAGQAMVSGRGAVEALAAGMGLPGGIKTSRETGQGRPRVSVPETIVVVLIAAVHGMASVLGFVQLVRPPRRRRSILWLLVLAGVVLGAVLLGLRAARIHAVPLTNTYEACICLAVVFGVLRKATV